MGINDSWTNGGIRMRLKDGSLYRRPMDQDLWEFYDFNRIYAGFYPACLFTALSVQRGLFYAAAIDAEGETHVYTSIAGEVWDAVNLTTAGVFGRDTARGRVLKIFGSTKLDQVFLLTDAGQLITLPNCPKCVRILRLGGKPRDAETADSCVRITMEDGSVKCIAMGEAAQYQVSWSYAVKLREQGAELIDLRDRRRFEQWHLNGSINIPAEEFRDWILEKSTDKIYLFICQNGTLSQEAARYARNQGFARSYTMGGFDNYSHVL